MLLPQRAVFWSSKSMLIISDLHLGKAGHFRKHGIPISRKVHLVDLQNLAQLIDQCTPAKVILLGDLFHSFENKEWLDFIRFVDYYPQIKFILVKGNHDILGNYPATLQVVDKLEVEPFSFTHIQSDEALYNISGHIHPGITIRGRARQGMTFACFLFGKKNAVLPAFGQFTGIKKIRPVKSDKVFAIAEDQVIELMR